MKILLVYLTKENIQKLSRINFIREQNDGTLIRQKSICR